MRCMEADMIEGILMHAKTVASTGISQLCANVEKDHRVNTSLEHHDCFWTEEHVETAMLPFNLARSGFSASSLSLF